MTTTNGNRKILDQKRWEFGTPAPVVTAAGAFVASARDHRQLQLYVQSNTVAYLFNPAEEGWVQVPNPTLLNAIAAGACGVAGSFSTGISAGVFYLQATAGTTTSITTNQTLARDLRGYSVHIMGGPNAGKTKVIASNTQTSGTSVITFEGAPETNAFTDQTLYRLATPVWYVLTAGTAGSGIFKKYDFATNTWVTLAHTGFAGTIGTDCRLVATPSWIDGGYKTFVTGTATSGGVNLINHTGKNWATNQWANAYQLRITAGTGAGQVRPIASNTATQITVVSGGNWTVNPDNTSQYAIEGNDDFLYLIGNNATATYRYSISGNSWSNLSPSPARGAAPGAGMSGHWVWSAAETDWSVENAIINGRRIYSFRGAAGAALDYYDIPSNGWVNAVYAPNTEVFGAGTKYIYKGSNLYIQKDATGRWFRHNFVIGEMDGWGTLTYTQGAALVGDTAFDVTYKDGATEITYAYMLLNTSTVMLRQMVI
jgi:hypothetical protein